MVVLSSRQRRPLSAHRAVAAREFQTLLHAVRHVPANFAKAEVLLIAALVSRSGGLLQLTGWSASGEVQQGS